MPAGLEPQIVEEAKYRPGKCLASGDTEGPFIDAGRWTRERDPYVQLSVRWVEEVARDLLGMVPKAEVDARFARLEAEHREYAEQLAALKRLAEVSVEFKEVTEAVAAQSDNEKRVAAESVLHEPHAVDALTAPVAEEFAA